MHQSPLGVANLSQSPRGYVEILLRSPTTFRCWFAQHRGHESFFFKALQRGVHAANDDFPTTVLFYLPANGYAVGIFTEAHQRKHYYQLEFSKMAALLHFFYYSEEIVLRKWADTFFV